MALLDELLVAIGVKTDDLTNGTAEAAQQTESNLKNIAAGAAGVAVGALFVAGLNSAMDISAATTKLTNQLGLTGQEAERVGNLSSDLFAAGWGESAAAVGESLGAVVKNMGDLASTTDAELESMTKGALALADTFEFDVAESSQAAGTLIKAGLVDNGTEAFDLLTKAAQQLPPAMVEELPTLTTEYSEFFSQMGFSGEEMFGLIAQAAKNPTFELDKLGDAVKEFTLRLADTEAVKEPLEDLKLDVKDIQGLVNSGQGTKAFDMVTEALAKVEDQTERTALQAALFGGPGEDMGLSLLAISAQGADAATGMDQAAGSTAKIAEAMENSPAQQWDATMRTVTTTIGEALLPVISKLAGFMAAHPGLVQALIPILGGLVLVLGLAAVAVWAVNTAMAASPIAWIILGIVALVAAIALIIIKWDEVAAATARAWDWITGKLSAAWSWITSTASSAWSSISGAVSSAWSSIEEKVGSAVNWIQTKVGELAAVPGKVKGWFGDIVSDVAAMPGKIAAFGRDMFTSIPDGFRSAINGVIGGWNRLHFTVGGGSFLGVSVPSFTLHTPDIPMLAAGGIVPSQPGGMLAVIGEGRQDEAVIPLDRLDHMMRSVAGSVRYTGGGGPQPIVFDVRNGSDELVALLRKWVSSNGGGSVQAAFGTR